MFKGSQYFQMPLHLSQKTQVDDIAISSAPIVVIFLEGTGRNRRRNKNYHQQQKTTTKKKKKTSLVLSLCLSVLLYTLHKTTNTLPVLCSGYTYLLHQISVWPPKRSSTATLMDHRTSQA